MRSLYDLFALPFDIALEMVYLFYFVVLAPIALGMLLLPLLGLWTRSRRSRERARWTEDESEVI